MRHHARVGQIEHAVMCGAVLSHDPGAVDGEDHVEPRQGAVDGHLVDGALQKRRVDGHDRLLAARRQAGGHAHRMLFGNAGIDEPVGELLGERRKPRAVLHGGRDGHDVRVLPRLAHDGLAEHVGIGRGRGLLLHQFPGGYVVGAYAMEAFGVARRGFVPGAFLRDHVHEHGAVGGKHGGKRFAQGADVVPIDGRRAQDAQLLEDHRARNDELLHRFLHVAPEIGERRAERAAAFQLFLQRVARLTILRGSAHVAQMLHERAHVARNGHLVVVQDDDKRRLRLADVVQGLERHATRKGRVADDGHNLFGASPQVARLR